MKQASCNCIVLVQIPELPVKSGCECLNWFQSFFLSWAAGHGGSSWGQCDCQHGGLVIWFAMCPTSLGQAPSLLVHETFVQFLIKPAVCIIPAFLYGMKMWWAVANWGKERNSKGRI